MAGMDIGIDLGTTSILVYMNGEVIINEPSVVAVNCRTDEVLAVGQDAFKMIGKTPAYINAEFPIRDGVISNYYYTEMMLKYFLKKACHNLMIKPRVTICIPSGITKVEMNAIVDSAASAGIRKIYLIEEPVAAAMGAGIDISKPNGNLVVDIGGGTTDIAVISLNGVVVSKSIKVAGNTFDFAIIKYIQNTHKILIGQRMAEQIKINIGNVFNPSDNIAFDVKGRNLVTGLPQKISISQKDLYNDLNSIAMEIVKNIKLVLEKTPPELVGDIYENGILITGGGCLINGLSLLIEQEIKVRCNISDDPINSVAIGTGKSFDIIKDLQQGFENAAIYKF